MSDKLVLAIPSKGRLMEAAQEAFLEAGFKVSRKGGDRRYKGVLKGAPDVEVRFLSASEIASGLIAGDIHLGITGRDLLHEKMDDPDEAVMRLTALGFGHADVVVAVPEAWFDVDTMADLLEVAAELRHEQGRMLRVATKFTNITRNFFARHAMADYRIVESLGATEGAPAAGTADVIVDITSSGATLVANHLKILDDGVMLRSEAFLCASLSAEWPERARAAVEKILIRLAARERAKENVEIRLDASAIKLSEMQSVLSGAGGSFAFGAPEEGEQEFIAYIPRVALHDVAADLKTRGCNTVTAREVDFIHSASNPLFDGLIEALAK